MPVQRELTAAEISDLLDRSPDLAARVSTHNALIKPQWDQGSMQEWNLPIPTRGYSLTDSKYGQVIVFPDAKGNLHFNGFVGGTVGAEIDKPVFESPSGNTIEQYLSDFQKGIQTTLGTIVSAAIIIGVVYVVVNRK